MLQFWKAFDLDSKRLVLDTQGSAMKSEKDSSLRSRKKLAETTKAFRKLPESDKVAATGGLLRAYQEEIDSLTKRAKFAENAFFMLYKGLFAAPDPVPSLEAALDAKTSDVEEQNKKLRRELREYALEFASLKNQDITIRKLEEQVAAFEHETDALVHARVAAQCRELESQLESSRSELAQQRVDYERQLEHSRRELRDAFQRLDAMHSDLFARKQRDGLAKTAFSAELEMISQEALLAQTLQLENAQLKAQLDEWTSGSGSNSADRSAVVASELADRDAATIQSLRQEAIRLNGALASAHAAARNDRDAADAALQHAVQRADELATQLSARPTLERFNDVLHQLHVLQQLEFNIVDDDDDNSHDASAALEASTSGSAGGVEKLLVTRVRRLEHVLQQTEGRLEQTQSDLARARDDLVRESTVVRDQAALLRHLEEHVAALERRQPASLLRARADVGAEILLDAMDEPLDEPAAGGSAGADNTMLEIVRGQRDRFRERMKELQSEKSRADERVGAYKASVARLENDNMQLYHKIRYLQSYRGGAGPGASRASQSVDQLEAGGDVEARYRGLYEEKLNPFVQFNKMESQQRFSNLNAVDKVLLTSARMFLGHRITRNLAFGYIVVLHFLVVATLYTFLHSCGISNA